MEQKNYGADPIAQAKMLAGTPAGQELIRLLQQSGGTDLKKAMEQAAAGDFTRAKDTLSTLLDTPEAKKLMQQLGR